MENQFSVSGTDLTVAGSTDLALLDRPLEPFLDAATLNAQADQAVAAFFHEGASRNTARTYRTALQYWGAWHVLRYGVPITGPVSVTAVLQFIIDHLEHHPEMPARAPSPFTPSSVTTHHLLPVAIDRVLVNRKYKARLGPWSLSTVVTRLAALSRAHQGYLAANPHLGLGPEANPMTDVRVRQLLGAVRRTYARRPRAMRRPDAATRPVIEALLATCENDLAGIRDRALILFGFASGGRRRSEIAALSYDNLRRDGEGYVFNLAYSKTNRAGRKDPNNFKPIQGSAAVAMTAWLEQLRRFRILEGPIFRRILHDRIVEPITGHAVREIVKRRALLANQPLGRMSAHSLRSGFVTEAGKQGIPLAEAMALTGHRSVQTVVGYYHAGEVSASRAGRLMEDPKK